MTDDELRALAQPFAQRMGVDVNTVTSIVLVPEEVYIEYRDGMLRKTISEQVVQS